MSLLAELKRRNVFKVGAAYLVVAWLLIQVAATVAPQLNLPEWAPRLITLLLMLGFPIALLIAWFLEHTPDGIKVESAPDGNKRMVVAALVLAAVAIGWFLRKESKPESAADAAPSASSAPAPRDADSGPAAAKPPDGPARAALRSVAVLPFVNMSQEAENEFFADGVSEEILNSLTRIDGMQVVGRTSSFQFKGKTDDLRAIGAKLGVANVLEGSVRRSGARARITAQLIRVGDGMHLWSQTYDRDLADTFAVQLDIAEKVAEALDVVLDDAQRERMRVAGVKNVDAFIAYQKGRKLFQDAHDPGSSDNLIATLRLAKVEFDRATVLEPGMTEAYQFGTDLHTHIVMSAGATDAERAAAVTEANRLLDLAAKNVHNAAQRESIAVDRQLLSDDWHGLAQRFASVNAQPNCGQGIWGMVAAPLGFADERIAYVEQALKCDPLNAIGLSRGAEAALWAGRAERALEFVESGRAASIMPSTVTSQGVAALVALGRIDEARAMLATMDPASPLAAMCQLQIAAATGQDLAPIRAQHARAHRGGWNPEMWTFVDGLAENLAGDRAAANRRAAAMDAQPGGSLKLAVYITLCRCGAPFDLDATPNFKARLAEAGLPWPPPDPISGTAPGGRP